MPTNGNGAIHLAQGLGSDDRLHERITTSLCYDRCSIVNNIDIETDVLELTRDEVKQLVREVLEHAETR